jgi:sec-independent protein translocase protein TatB
MEILGVGPSELIFIVIIALIVLGPKDMQKAGRSIGKWLRTIVTSDGWKLFQQTSREIQTLPNRLMREAALDELKQTQGDLKQSVGADLRLAGSPVATSPQIAEPLIRDPEAGEQPKILPPASRPPSDAGEPDA